MKDTPTPSPWDTERAANRSLREQLTKAQAEVKRYQEREAHFGPGPLAEALKGEREAILAHLEAIGAPSKVLECLRKRARLIEGP